MIRAIFFDVDGTLLSFQTHEMTELTRKSLDELKKKGVKLFIATGRSPLSFQHLSKLINYDFDGYIFCNGQYVTIGEQVIHDQPLDRDGLVVLSKYIENKEIATTFTEIDYSYMNLINDRVYKLQEMLGHTLIEPELQDMSKRIMEHKTYQLSAYIVDEEEDEFFNISDKFRGVRWHPIFTDVIPRDGGKDVGIQKVLDFYGFDRSEAMAFGDGGNDTDMISYVAYGIAMGNAVESAKKASVYVTAEAENEGIYKALRKFDLVGEL